MAELNLPVCPICEAPDSLFRKQMELKGQPYTWYECRACGSVLLSAEGGQWVYQKVEREEKAYLLKQPLTLADLEALLPRVEEEAAEPDAPAALFGWEVPDQEPPSSVGEEAWPAGPSRELEKAGLPADSFDRGAAEPDELEARVGWGVLEDELPADGEAVAGELSEADVPTVTVNWETPTVRVPQDEAEVRAHAEERPRSSPPRLFVWLVGLCVIAFLVLVAIVLYQVLIQSGLL